MLAMRCHGPTKFAREGRFSTRSNVSLTSGRGVGVAAVNHEVLELGGALSVHSQNGIGTCWRISIPLSPQHSAHTPGADEIALAPGGVEHRDCEPAVEKRLGGSRERRAGESNT